MKTSVLKNHKSFLLILLLAVLFRIYILLQFNTLWWDESVYIGMSKYIYSMGESGLFEHIRPPLLPIIIGFFWKIGLNEVLAAKIITTIFSIGCIILTYILAKRYTDAPEYASLLLAFSPIFLFTSERILTEIPSLFFILLAITFHKRFFLAGISLGLALLTKFTALFFIAIFAVIIIIDVLFKKKGKNKTQIPKIKEILSIGAKFTAGILAVTLPFFIANIFLYNNPFLPITAATAAIREVLHCNCFNIEPPYFYFQQILRDNIFHLFAIPGIYLLRKKHKLTAFLTIPLVYFTILTCKDIRYMIVFLPFLCIFSAKALEKAKLKTLMLGIVLIFSIFNSYTYLTNNTQSQLSQVEFVFNSYLADPLKNNIMYPKSNNNDNSTIVWISNPSPVVYSDNRFEMIYYDYNNKNKSIINFNQHIESTTSPPELVMIKSCDLHMLCAPEDIVCKSALNNTKRILASYNLIYNKTSDCTYQIYSKY